MDLVVGLDLGTTTCKASAISASGQTFCSAESTYGLHVPQFGWAEQIAAEVWQGAVTALQALAAQVPAGRLAALSLSGAMHNVFPVDAAGEPLAPAPTWADQRAAPQAAALRQNAAARALYQRTGCPLQALYHPAKLRWWCETAPEVVQRAARFVALKDWVLWRLAGAWVTDHGLASTTGLLDIRRLDWDAEALALAGIEADHLPRLIASTEIAGTLTPEAARLTGLPAGLPIVAGSSDGATANLGAGALAPGQTVITVGTSGAVRRSVPEPRLDPSERTWCYVLAPGLWLAGGAINNGGLALRWVRERFYPDLAGDAGYEQLLRDAAEVAAGSDGVLVLPYFTGERSPHWNTAARGLLSGLGLAHTRGHLARATLEGVAYCLADVWAALGLPPADDGPPARLTGSITRNSVWAQIVADVLGVRLTANEAADASVVGAAMLGHQALGHLASLEQAVGQFTLGDTYQPDPARHALYVQGHQAFQALYRALPA